MGVRRTLCAVSIRAMACRRFSSVLGPIPFKPWIRWASRAAFRSSRFWMPKASRRRSTFLGPSPGMRVRATNSGGYFSRRASSFEIRPVSTYSRIFLAVDRPIPGTLVSSFSLMAAMSPVSPEMA